MPDNDKKNNYSEGDAWYSFVSGKISVEDLSKKLQSQEDYLDDEETEEEEHER